jgi:hypothetical protein
VDSEQADPPDPTSKRRRLDSKINTELVELAKIARERRDHIREKIKTLGQLPNAAVQLSNPAFYTKLPFPFVGVVPPQFKVDTDSEENWFYVGREKFMELLDRLRYVQKAWDRSALWVYGTKGYGTSHLLAALVCYLAAQEERVVYIPDCRECVKNPVVYVQAAMLFAWADDKTMQDYIITLDTQEEIERFFKGRRNTIIFIDQVNDFEGMEWETRSREVKRWLDSCRVGHTGILGTSANYRSYCETALDDDETSEDTIRVYGGFTKVSLSKE